MFIESPWVWNLVCISLSISFFFRFKLYIKRKQCDMVFKSRNTCYSRVQLAGPIYICGFSLSTLFEEMLCNNRPSTDTILTCYNEDQLYSLCASQVFIRNPNLVFTLSAYDPNEVSGLAPSGVEPYMLRLCWLKTQFALALNNSVTPNSFRPKDAYMRR